MRHLDGVFRCWERISVYVGAVPNAPRPAPTHRLPLGGIGRIGHPTLRCTSALRPGRRSCRGGLFRLAWKAHLLWERKHVAFALLAVTTPALQAHVVRDRLQIEHLKALKNDLEFTTALWKGGIDDDLDVSGRRDAISWARDDSENTQRPGAPPRCPVRRAHEVAAGRVRFDDFAGWTCLKARTQSVPGRHSPTSDHQRVSSLCT